MVDLKATSPFGDSLPQSAGNVTLRDAMPEYLMALMPYDGTETACAEALQKAHEVALPAAGRVLGKAAARVIWAGLGQYFYTGNAPLKATIARHAAIVDQSDAWAVMVLEGEGAAEVLARLTPIDLRPASFKRGHTARSELAHMMAVISRTPKGFEIMVMRSFARTAVQRLVEAMHSCAAQSQID